MRRGVTRSEKKTADFFSLLYPQVDLFILFVSFKSFSIRRIPRKRIVISRRRVRGIRETTNKKEKPKGFYLTTKRVFFFLRHRSVIRTNTMKVITSRP